MAALGVAPGYPQYSGLLNPTIWSPRVVEKFYEFCVLADIANTNYEGAVANQGDTVTIRSRPDIVTRKFQKGQQLEVQIPDQPTTELELNFADYYNFLVEDVDRAMSDMDYFEEWTADAAEKLVSVVDETCLQDIYTDAGTTLSGATAGRKSASIDLGTAASPVTLTKDGASDTAVIDYIVDCGLALDEERVPHSGRKLVIPAWMNALIKKSDLKDASITGDGTSILRTGRIGIIDRFEVYVSNQLWSSATATNVLFLHESALTFANVLTKSDVIKSERMFGTLARGLTVYGIKVINDRAFGSGFVAPA